MKEHRPLYTYYTVRFEMNQGTSYNLMYRTTSKTDLNNRIKCDYESYDVKSHKIILTQPIFSSNEKIFKLDTFGNTTTS